MDNATNLDSTADMGGQDQTGADNQNYDNNANQQNDVYEKRYKDTQSAYTRSQQELAATRQTLAELQGTVKELSPAAEYLKHNQKFFNPEATQPKSVWEAEGGIDGALSARDRQIAELNQKFEAVSQAAVAQQTWQMQQQFRQDQRRLYQEIGANEFGSEDAFAEALKTLPQHDPNWERSYLSAPSYETLKRSYYTMRGAAEYDPNSNVAKVIEARRQQAFLQKQSNYLGSNSVNYGPSSTSPSQAYITPISQS